MRSTVEGSRRGVKEYVAIVLKGAAMGAADVIPGVSGGTIAFISGIYEELLGSIKNIDLEALKMLLTLRFVEFWQKINGNFLMAVFCGVGLSILSLAKVMTYLLASHPILVWSFFFGLIIASSILVFRQVKSFNLISALSIVVGATLAYFITVLSPAQTPTDWWFIFLCGAVAICAMILPGISGSFILLLMGKYLYILGALSSVDIVTILLFGSGALVGIVSFSHLLSWLLNNFHTATVSLLTGFMIGSLNKVWPWKEVVETTLNSHGEMVPLVERNLWPAQFEAITSNSSQLLLAILMAIVGFLLIYVIELVGSRMGRE
ncbi:MAG: DUF368 domain-containing protein [Rikenellaceae bacterium]